MNAIQGIYTIGNEVYKIGKNYKGSRGIEKSQVFLMKQKDRQYEKDNDGFVDVFLFL
ncbi:MAG: hypothetical protein KAZ20_03105 [Sediminibacterium sp.]|nr:hypothetical protein [Sediminibacterium sp.]